MPSQYIFSHAVVLFAFDDFYHFALLQSRLHEVWLRRLAATMRTDINYTPSTCFQTFPFPQDRSDVNSFNAEKNGEVFYNYRQIVMNRREIGLTKLYNFFNNSGLP